MTWVCQESIYLILKIIFCIVVRPGSRAASVLSQYERWSWLLCKVERIKHSVGPQVALRQWSKIKDVFREAQHRRKLVLRMVDIALFRIGRDDYQGDAESKSIVIDLLWANVVVETAKVIPGEKHGRR